MMCPKCGNGVLLVCTVYKIDGGHPLACSRCRTWFDTRTAVPFTERLPTPGEIVENVGITAEMVRGADTVSEAELAASYARMPTIEAFAAAKAGPSGDRSVPN